MVAGSGTLDIFDGGVVSRPKAKSVTHVSGTACHLESLIESFIELMSQVFMLPIFHRRTSC